MQDRDPHNASFSILCLLDIGPLAQLVEQLTLNQRVRSSSLRRPTKILPFPSFALELLASALSWAIYILLSSGPGGIIIAR